MKNLNKKIQEHFDQKMKGKTLFRVELSGRQIWDKYLQSFSEENNPKFRDPESSSHNCNHCKNFIRRYANVVAIDDDYNLITLFDVDASEEYRESIDVIAEDIRNSKVADVFFETFTELNSLPYESCKMTQNAFKLGVVENHKKYTKTEAETFGVVKEDEIRTFNHFSLKLPKQYVDMSGNSVESIMAGHRDAKNVFQRAMGEISLETLELVRDLINQGSLLNGDSHLHKLDAIIPLKEEYDNNVSTTEIGDKWCWVKSNNFQFAKFRNELIGVLCTELSQGEELNKACTNWNKRVDPANYMKAKAPITKRQIQEAQNFVEENGYEASFNRRIAIKDDIDVSEILHVNSGNGSIVKGSIFDNVKSTKKGRHSRNKFENLEEISIDKFMDKILPTATSLEVFLENSHEGNMVTLTTANDLESKPIFNYSNNYSQTFSGNLAGKSEIKDQVVSQGGKVGVLRFSIMWSPKDSIDNSDLDAHCVEPSGFEIYFSSKVSRTTGGNLDIDITNPRNHKQNGKGVVENITYPSISKMKDGTYMFYVNQYSGRNSQGFTAEIEFNGEIYSYTYSNPVRGEIPVAEVILKDGEFTINHKLPETNQSREIYGLETKEFHKVNLMCLSPNHWGDNKVGDKHYLFMLDNCKAPGKIRSFHNVDLIPKLRKHRKVLEVLGNSSMIKTTDKNELSGLGFNATVNDELIVKVQGSHKRMLKIKF